MAETLVIIDYGSGNLKSAERAFQRAASQAGLAVDIIVSHEAEKVLTADRLVLPGVGAFGDCAAGIRKIDGLWSSIDQSVMKRAVPFFGICVGMQLMARKGLEHGEHDGFGWIDSVVIPIEQQCDNKGRPLKIPHMGWNSLDLRRQHPVLTGIANGHEVYFVHSYHMTDETFGTSGLPLIATTDYGGDKAALVGKDTVIGSQFHPEKSQRAGLQIIENFLRWKP